ncbi:MAG TPA: response regulator [Candidatus Handelsmanbacteria bacterium]|nr:response regulator [Candidatus Handelsmanbacteria bacterium]
MITTRGNKKDIVAASKAGVDNYATKPVTPDELQDQIAKACKKID